MSSPSLPLPSFEPTKIMLDLETLGTTPGSVIVAIGAVKFGRGQLHDEFYRRVDIDSCLAAGLTVDGSTIRWWLSQGDSARQEIVKAAMNLPMVLNDFSAWIGDPKAEIWGNGAAFDNALLAAAYAAAKLPLPWRYSKDRCYRTLCALYPDQRLERQGTHHNALDDASSQAIHLMHLSTLPLV